MKAAGDRPLDARAMTMQQVVAIGLCVLLNALDGFDVLAISFASPGIAGEWGIDRAALGIGGMLACTNAMAAELASARRRAAVAA